MEREVAVSVEESAQQLVLGWSCLWSEQDVEVTMELWEALKADWPKVGTLQFRRGHWADKLPSNGSTSG